MTCLYHSVTCLRANTNTSPIPHRAHCPALCLLMGFFFWISPLGAHEGFLTAILYPLSATVDSQAGHGYEHWVTWSHPSSHM